MTAEDVRKKIDALPHGGLTAKTIKGNKYIYYQWSELGHQRSKLVKGEELEALRSMIEERKALESKLKDIGLDKKNFSSDFITDVRIGSSLIDYSSAVKSYKKREVYSVLDEYIHGDSHDKVCILYGLRRTGKTTLIRQVIYGMTAEEQEKAVFVQVNSQNTLSDINKDLKRLESLGYRYVFIDEATLMADFIEGSALFSDVFAASGMKIVLSGTDSLGFAFSEDEELYDRCIMLHTTFIPFREFRRVLGINDIDEYIRYGGTMCRSGENYNSAIFSTSQSTDEYVNTAIARNIQHSLRNYQRSGHFRALKELYDNNELTNAINRIVEDMNHEFTIEVLTREFRSHDLGIARSNLRKDRKDPTDILDDIDDEKVTETLMKLLEIINKENQSIEIKDVHRKEIKEYFELLDLTSDNPLVDIDNLNSKKSITVFSQPGLRYSQSQSLIKSLMMDEAFKDVSAVERKRITDRILDDVKGRILEELVLLETKMAYPSMEVFKLQFAVGEFDMVVYNPEEVNCRIYEVKHSKEQSPYQYRHLADDAKCLKTEFRYGTILSKTVLYRGQTQLAENGIEYKNVEEYLSSLKSAF